MRPYLFFLASLLPIFLASQNFHFGNDLSYVNEMEDCGVVYHENGEPKDVHQIFADHGGTTVRLRLWHTPNWYDDLNEGHRYSDFADVKKAIQRAKTAGMSVLLDFHLSDNWADPNKQLVPAAWLSVVDDLPMLKDSLYNYISQTLTALHAENLLPEMVQIGNETNRGILLSPEDNQVWTLDWPRNAELFNAGIQAVRDVETATGKSIGVALHIAGPDDVEYYTMQFVQNGVTDFDIIGMSYYWHWHQPATIQTTGETIASLRQTYPEKQVMVFETAYPWTDGWNDNASNIATGLHPDYSPASPENQNQWMIDLASEIMANGGSGLFYWEPAWVSSPCWTQWGEGSHGEHLAFFDFENNLIENGGINWMEHEYATPATERFADGEIKIALSADQRILSLFFNIIELDTSASFRLYDMSGKMVKIEKINGAENMQINLPKLSAGIYVVNIMENGRIVFEEKIMVK